MSKEIRKRGNHIWNYFKKIGKTAAKCSLCKLILKIGDRPAPLLRRHLKYIHEIDITSSKTSIPQAGPSISKDEPVIIVDSESDSEEFNHNIAKKSTMREHSNEFRIARMVVKDGMSFKFLSTSEDLRCLFVKSGFILHPTSPSDIKTIVENFTLTVKDEIRNKLERLKTSGEKFSLTLDRWTSVKNKIYLNVNVHHLDTYFNLGLIRIHNSSSTEDCVNLVKMKLEKFLLHLDTDIIGITTDDVSLTKKMARLLSCYRQLCFAQGIHLAVVDTLYQNAPAKQHVPRSSHSEEVPAVYSSDDDNYSCDDETNGEHIFSFSHLQLKQAPAELKLNYRGLIEKIRNVVIFFRKHASKEACLQKYVQKHLDKKDYRLILDRKDKWSSLFYMLERFNILKDCIREALINVESDIEFSNDEWTKIESLFSCLHPVKLAVEALCRRDSTLLTADVTLRFMLEKLNKQQTNLSADLATALRKIIKERRSELSGIILYLHNPQKYKTCVTTHDDTFSMPQKDCILSEIKNICEKMLTLNTTKDEEAIKSESVKIEEITIEDNFSLNKELEIQLIKEESDTCTVNESMHTRDFKKIINAEMTEYENSGVKGKYLSLVQSYFNTIRPTSLEAEIAFSTSICADIPIKNKLTDKTIDMICFLRSYFKNNDM